MARLESDRIVRNETRSKMTLESHIELLEEEIKAIRDGIEAWSSRTQKLERLMERVLNLTTEPEEGY